MWSACQEVKSIDGIVKLMAKFETFMIILVLLTNPFFACARDRCQTEIVWQTLSLGLEKNRFKLISYGGSKQFPAVIKARLYKAFIMPHFQYCSTIWHFCGARNSEKLELLNKHALRIILSDNVSTYEVLLEKLDLIGLSKRRFLDMLILVYKSFQAATPAYITALLTPRTNIIFSYAHYIFFSFCTKSEIHVLLSYNMNLD